jgi:hypothetical protein
MTHRSHTEKSVRDKPVRIGVFDRVQKAEQVVQDLLAAGFTKDQISVICSDPAKEAHFPGFEEKQAGEEAPKRAAVGGAIGAALGGLAAAAMVTTGGMAIVVVGPLLTAMASGGIIGGFIGAMTSRGVDKEAAEFYEQSIEKGRIVVVAEDDSEQAPRKLRSAEQVFTKAGAEPIPLHAG